MWQLPKVILDQCLVFTVAVTHLKEPCAGESTVFEGKLALVNPSAVGFPSRLQLQRVNRSMTPTSHIFLSP